MKLYSSSTTPFGRKVEVVAIEKGLVDDIEIIPISTAPSTPHEGLARVNPLIKLPALVQDDGRPMYDSLVICDYLDTLRPQPKLIPAAGARRWEVLTVHALASGICEAAVLSRYEQALRPEPLRWPDWIASQMKKIGGGLDWLEGNIGVLGDAGSANVDLGQLAVGCALGYLDFRFADVRWRETRPRLATWAGAISKRPSMQRTMPAA